jgi:hypothetical protein
LLFQLLAAAGRARWHGAGPNQKFECFIARSAVVVIERHDNSSSRKWRVAPPGLGDAQGCTKEADSRLIGQHWRTEQHKQQRTAQL